MGGRKCPGWGPEKEHLRGVERIPRVVEEGSGKKDFWTRQGNSKGVELQPGSRLAEDVQKQIYLEVVIAGPLEGLLESNIRIVLLEIARIRCEK